VTWRTGSKLNAFGPNALKKRGCQLVSDHVKRKLGSAAGDRRVAQLSTLSDPSLRHLLKYGSWIGGRADFHIVLSGQQVVGA
jgi:hypothetical protein